MTASRQEAIRMLERVPDDKIDFVIQIMQGINGLLGVADAKVKQSIDLEQFVMPATDRGQNADDYVRKLRDDDRL